jgi:hypothetical protein
MADIIFPDEGTKGVIGADLLPTNVDLVFWKGDVVDFTVRFMTDAATPQPIPLSGFTASAVLKASFNSPTSYNFTCTIQNTNEVRVYMSSPVSKTVPAGDYIWNLQLTAANGDVRTRLAGDVTVYAEVDA